jgi:hypothetical protein
METTPKLRTLIRKAAGLEHTSRYPIVVVEGDAPPRLVGRKWHYTTPNGTPVRFPSAYRKKFGQPVYVPSSLRVEVGREFVEYLQNLS